MKKLIEELKRQWGWILFLAGLLFGGCGSSAVNELTPVQKSKCEQGICAEFCWKLDDAGNQVPYNPACATQDAGTVTDCGCNIFRAAPTISASYSTTCGEYDVWLEASVGIPNGLYACVPHGAVAGAK